MIRMWLLYLSLVFKTSLVSLMKSAPRIIECFCVFDVAKIFMSSEVSLTTHCRKCAPTGYGNSQMFFNAGL